MFIHVLVVSYLFTYVQFGFSEASKIYAESQFIVEGEFEDSKKYLYTQREKTG